MRGKARIFTKNDVSVWMRKVGDRYWIINGVLVYLDENVNDRSDLTISKIVNIMNTSFLFVPSFDFCGVIVVRAIPETDTFKCGFFSRLTVEDKILEKIPDIVEDYKIYIGYYDEK